MDRTRIVIAALTLGLVGSLGANTYLLSRLGGCRGAAEKAGFKLRAASKASSSARLLLPLVANGKTTKSDIIQALQKTDPTEQPQDVDGATVIGGLVLRFDATGTVQEVGAASPGVID